MPSEGRTLDVVHVTPTLSWQGGGVATYIWSLVEHHGAVGLRPTVIGLEDGATAETIARYNGRFTVYSTPARLRQSLGYSPAMRQQLAALTDIDLIHSHGLRMMPALDARRESRRRGVPLIISPHGQLEPWIVQRNALPKRIYHWLIEDRNLRHASAIHTTAIQEARNARLFGVRVPIAVVPIGLDIEPYGAGNGREIVESRWPQLRDRRLVLFLSRIDPKKGLLNLTEAWGRIGQKWSDWHLVVAGLELNEHRDEVREAFAEAGVGGGLSLVGQVTDEEKLALLDAADLFVLPTFSENFGIVIAEALASYTPVITTRTTPWHYLEEEKCGWWIEVGAKPLIEAFEAALSLPDEERRSMGARGRRLIERHFSWPVLARQMRQLYDWTLGNAAQPPFVWRAEEAIPERLA